MTNDSFKRGDRLAAFRYRRPKDRIYLIVTRVARDGSWIDVACHTWAVRWGRRLPVDVLREMAVRQRWGWEDLVTQQSDHEKWLRSRGL